MFEGFELSLLSLAVLAKNRRPFSLVMLFSESTWQPQSDHQKYSFQATFALYYFYSDV